MAESRLEALSQEHPDDPLLQCARQILIFSEQCQTNKIEPAQYAAAKRALEGIFLIKYNLAYLATQAQMQVPKKSLKARLQTVRMTLDGEYHVDLRLSIDDYKKLIKKTEYIVNQIIRDRDPHKLMSFVINISKDQQDIASMIKPALNAFESDEKKEEVLPATEFFEYVDIEKQFAILAEIQNAQALTTSSSSSSSSSSSAYSDAAPVVLVQKARPTLLTSFPEKPENMPDELYEKIHALRHSSFSPLYALFIRYYTSPPDINTLQELVDQMQAYIITRDTWNDCHLLSDFYRDITVHRINRTKDTAEIVQQKTQLLIDILQMKHHYNLDQATWEENKSHGKPDLCSLSDLKKSADAALERIKWRLILGCVWHDPRGSSALSSLAPVQPSSLDWATWQTTSCAERMHLLLSLKPLLGKCGIPQQELLLDIIDAVEGFQTDRVEVLFTTLQEKLRSPSQLTGAKRNATAAALDTLGAFATDKSPQPEQPTTKQPKIKGDDKQQLRKTGQG